MQRVSRNICGYSCTVQCTVIGSGGFKLSDHLHVSMIEQMLICLKKGPAIQSECTELHKRLTKRTKIVSSGQHDIARQESQMQQKSHVVQPRPTKQGKSRWRRARKWKGELNSVHLVLRQVVGPYFEMVSHPQGGSLPPGKGVAAAAAAVRMSQTSIDGGDRAGTLVLARLLLHFG